MNSVEKPVVHGPVDGNAFAVLGAAAKALKDAGQGDRVEEMREKATSGDYYHLLSTVMEYVDFDFCDPDEDEDEDDDDPEWEDDEEDGEEWEDDEDE